MRFIAAFLIILYHAFHFYGPQYSIVDTWHAYNDIPRIIIIEGHTAVALFMTLSGFIFTLITYNKPINYGKFICNRFLRIYPLYIFVLFLVVSIQKSSVAWLITALFFVRNMAFPTENVQYVAHLWTIATEFQFYLIFPFIIQFFSRYGQKYLWGVIMLLTLIRLMVFLKLGSVRDLSYMSLFGRLDQFLLGCIAARTFQLSSTRTPLNAVWAGLSWLPIIGALLGFHALGGYTLEKSPLWIIWPTIEGAAWALVIYCYCQTSWALPARISKGLAFLGTLSFSLYINHWFFVNNSDILHRIIFFHHHPFVNYLLMTLLVIFPLIVLLSLLTYHVIELPFMQLRQKYVPAA